MKIARLKYSLQDPSKGRAAVKVVNSSFLFSFPCTNQSNCTPYIISIPAGIWRIECWGASGGKEPFNGEIAFGAYASGSIVIRRNTKMMAFIGGRGSDSIAASTALGGWNGGGTASGSGSGGGGGTDIRLDERLQSRIIVAAGAGGGERKANGHGGKINGINGQSTKCDDYFLETGSTGGNQTHGGIGGYKSGYYISPSGSFGKGGNSVHPNYLHSLAGGAGGGGYYGGGSTPCACSGSGGSSYISGYPECNSVQDSEEIIHTNSPNHYSGYIFYNSSMHSGNETMPLPYSLDTTGKAKQDNGFIRITLILSLFSGHRKKFTSIPISAILQILIISSRSNTA